MIQDTSRCAHNDMDPTGEGADGERMSIFIGRETRLCVQGITGRDVDSGEVRD